MENLRKAEIMKNIPQEENDEKIENAIDEYISKLKADFIANCVHDGHRADDVMRLVDEGCWSLDKFIMFQRINELRFWRNQEVPIEKTKEEKLEHRKKMLKLK